MVEMLPSHIWKYFSFSKALKELLGTISMEPVTDKGSDFFYIVSEGDIKFKPYYIAHTKIQTLALLDDKYKGSNWLHWLTWKCKYRETPARLLILDSYRVLSISFEHS
jgi:hypothetical protein